jgi:two-component system sensor histidine kinase KdpD
MIRVTDHGPGVPLEDRQRIFEAFASGNNGSGGPGTGLGLAIAKGFTQLNGGSLWIEGGRGSGTTFVVSFPAQRGAGVARR